MTLSALLTHLLRRDSGNIRFLATFGNFKKNTLRKIRMDLCVWIILFAWVLCHVNPVSVRMFDGVLLGMLMASASPDPDVLCWNALLSPGDKDHINLGPQINIVQTSSYWIEETWAKDLLKFDCYFQIKGRTCVERKWYDLRIEWSASNIPGC